MREALGDALVSGYELVGLTVTFPGYGNCASYCGCHGARRKFGTDVGTWNGTFTERFNDLMTEVRRLLGVDVQYVRLLEPQMGERIRDGRKPTHAFHAHVALMIKRSSGKQWSSWSKRKWRKLLADHGFGHEFVLRPMSHRGDVDAAVRYFTGYAKNVADQLRAVPYVHPVTQDRMPSRCRAFTGSRRYSESVGLMRYRYASKMREREAAEEREIAGWAPAVRPALPCVGAAGALDSLFEELRKSGLIESVSELSAVNM